MIRKLIQEDVKHIPVLGDEVSRYIVNNKNGIYIDATFGGGGHSQKILDLLDEGGRLIAFDLDSEAFNRGKELEKKDSRFQIVKRNFAEIEDYLTEAGIGKVDGIVFDLGISTFQLSSKDRGFSYSFDEADLDMRMDNDLCSVITASEILNHYSREKLSHIFKRYGDIKNPSRLVQNISLYRKKHRSINKVGDFVDIVHKSWTGGIDFIKLLSQCFQALRIEVNKELDSLEKALQSLSSVMNKGGIAAIITFHSIEENKVKNWQYRYCHDICIHDYGSNVLNQFSILSKNCIYPSLLEKSDNWSSRSAKLWLVQKN